MRTLLCLCLLAGLLIGGCGPTKLVTAGERDRGSVQIAPLLDNPTQTENTASNLAPAETDFCLGLISHLYF